MWRKLLTYGYGTLAVAVLCAGLATQAKGDCTQCCWNWFWGYESSCCANCGCGSTSNCSCNGCQISCNKGCV